MTLNAKAENASWHLGDTSTFGHFKGVFQQHVAKKTF